MNQPQVYMCPPHPESPSYLPPPRIPLGCPRVPAASCIKLAMAICFTYGNVHISVLFSQVIPPLPSEVQGQISSAHKEGEETAYRFDSFSPSLSAHPFH